MNSNKQFTFNKEKHEYLLDGKRMTGCTTILGILAKPALIPWASKMATEYIRENIGKFDIKDPKQFEQLLLEAKNAHAKRKEKAGDWGTKTHEEISNFINWWIKFNTGKGPGKPQKWSEPVIRFMKWGEENKVKFLDTEKIIYSEKLFVAGTVDFVCEIDGQRWIGDIKTSGSGIYAENFFQCAGYDIMLEEMGEPKADGYLILNLKENGDFLEKRSVSNEENRKIFTNCLEIYRCQQKLTNLIK